MIERFTSFFNELFSKEEANSEVDSASEVAAETGDEVAVASESERTVDAESEATSDTDGETTASSTSEETVDAESEATSDTDGETTTSSTSEETVDAESEATSDTDGETASSSTAEAPVDVPKEEAPTGEHEVLVDGEPLPNESTEEALETDATTVYEEQEIASEENGFAHAGVAIAIGVIVLIGGVVALYLHKKKRKCKCKETGATGKMVGVQIANIHQMGKRESQQDSFGVSRIDDLDSKGVLAVVADGMGGLSGGAEVSAIATAHILSAFQRIDAKTNRQLQFQPEGILLQLVNDAHAKVRNYLIDNHHQQSGSTVVVALLKQNRLYFATVGDSRICLLRAGALTTLNREHTYASVLDEQVARGEISWETGQSDPQRKALTSYIGMDDTLQIDRNIQAIQLVEGDRLLLMSDGVFGSLSDHELVSLCSKADVYTCASEVERAIECKNKKNQDNFTAIIVEIGA